MMRHHLHPLLTVAFLFCLAACQKEQAEPKSTAAANCVVEGDVAGMADGDTLFISDDLDHVTPFDTLIIEQQRFSFTCNTDTTRFCVLYSPKYDNGNTTLFLEPGSIKVHLSTQPGESKVSGTHINEAWQVLNDSIFRYGNEVNQLMSQMYNAQSDDPVKNARIEELGVKMNQMVLQTAENNIDNELGYFMLIMFGDGQMISGEDCKRLISKMPEKIRQRQHIKDIEALHNKQSEGVKLTEFTMNDMNGSSVSVTQEVSKHKITIIDFWASWCGPCVNEMPHLVALYEQYSKRGLGIVGISLDNDATRWKDAVERLNMTWVQLSDLRGWDNAAAQLFHVQSIPHTIIVNSEGTILATGLRGPQLEAFIAQQIH